MSRGLKAAWLAGIILAAAGAAHCADVKVLATNGIQSVVEDLAPRFERASGHKLSISFSSGGVTVKRVQDGEAADVVIAPSPAVETLVKSGKVEAGNPVPVASTGISVAVRAGAAQPDLSSTESFRKALLAARSITYLNPADGGASGIHFASVLDRLGIADQMRPKTVLAPNTSALGKSIATGEAEIGVLQYQLLFAVPGIQVVDPLPRELQQTTVFSAAVLVDARQAEAAKAFLLFMRTPEAAALIRNRGMDPGSP